MRAMTKAEIQRARRLYALGWTKKRINQATKIPRVMIDSALRGEKIGSGIGKQISGPKFTHHSKVAWCKGCGAKVKMPCYLCQLRRETGKQ